MKFIWFIRSFIMTAFIPISVIILGPSAILFNFIFKSRKIDDLHLAMWGKFNCWMFGIRVQVTGYENIPDEGCLFLFNHSSFFDVFALSGYIPGIRFGAKAELFKIPIFSHTMRMMGTLPIARQNREEVFKVYEEAKVRFKNKEKFALSPEGGRFYGPHLAPFKAGPFVFAISAGVSVVPIVITGAHECLPKGHVLTNKDRKNRVINLHILKPVSTAEFDVYNRQQLQFVVYSKMDPIWVEYYDKEHSLK
ncbi:MAG: lysophospholipid acyltransferase family protein [Pseudobdellovibrio sp.]